MLGLLKVLIQGLLGGVALSLPEILRRVLIAFGIGAVTYTGFTILFNNINSLVLAQFSGIGGTVAQVLGLLEADRFCTNILSALSIRLTLNTFNGVSKQITF